MPNRHLNALSWMFVSLDLPTMAMRKLGTPFQQEFAMQFYLDNMTCGGCARAVARAIQSIDSSASITTDPPTRRVQIQTSEPQEQIVSALRETGFPPRAE
jgi:copper chaperone